MKHGHIKHSDQLNVLNWQTPEAHRMLNERLLRGNSCEHRLSRALTLSLDQRSLSRSDVAERMGDIMGIRINENSFKATTSPARKRHQISVPRFDALVSAPGDRRLLEFLCKPRGFKVMERTYWDAHQHDIARRKRTLRRSMLRR